MSLSPIILFCYNRHDKVIEVIKNLQKNNLAKDSELFIFCDGPRNENDLIEIKKTHEVLDNISGFKNITIEKRTLNFGLANSVIYGVSKVLQNYETAIVLEDDIIVAPNFLSFMNEALNFYKNDPQIFSITGFNYPKNTFKTPSKFKDEVFFVEGRGCSWGWATWKDRWQKVDFNIAAFASFKNNPEEQKAFNRAGPNLSYMLKLQMDGKIDSWAIRVAYHIFKNKLYTVFPLNTLVKNIGLDGSGSHGDLNSKMASFSFENHDKEIPLKLLKDVELNYLAEDEFIACTDKKPYFISKKNLVRIRYFIIGFLFAQIINFIIN